MNLDLEVKSNSYEGVKSQLLVEAERFYGDRRFGFSGVTVEMDGNDFSAKATAYEVNEPRPRPTKADVPAEVWDPFAGSYDSWAY